jgi:hypothetical protein
MKPKDITLRDYFAIQIMAQLIASYAANWKDLAPKAYELADAMLAEREKKK